MYRFFLISSISCKLTLKELSANKLRTFLSLLGVSFGIFCIISVLSTISSMQMAIAHDLKAIGNRVVFIQKFPSGKKAELPWWKYLKRPESKLSEMKMLQQKIPQIKNMACLMYISDSI